jgi:hypothetical protein
MKQCLGTPVPSHLVYLLESFGLKSQNVARLQKNHDRSGEARWIKEPGSTWAELRQDLKLIRASEL